MMTAFPPNIRDDTDDPAKYVISKARFVRPSLRAAPSGPEFEWPLGTEGIRVTGQVGVAQHLYLGDNAPVVQVVHRDARRFEMTGAFLGRTGSQNMRDLLEVITSPIPQGFWILRLPAAIFPREQTVVIENYDFDHPEEDRIDSWNYLISMTRTGVGGVIPGESGISTGNTSGNTATGDPKGESNKVFITRAGANTLRQVASKVYGDPNKWLIVYEKNKAFLDEFKQPLAVLQYSQLDNGLKLNV